MRKMAKLLKNQMRLHNIETSLKIKPNILILFENEKIRNFCVDIYNFFNSLNAITKKYIYMLG